MTRDTLPGTSPPPQVKCPTCGAPCLFAPSNPSRPFCSERCRGIDLGAWANERYRVSAPSGDAAPDPDPDDDGAPS